MIGWYWTIPLAVTIFGVIQIRRPFRWDSYASLADGVVRLLWLIPMLLSWAFYVIISAFFGKLI